jgi:hypothetical protein
MRSKVRSFCSAVAVVTLGAGGLMVIGAPATARSVHKRQFPFPIVYAGYTDTYRAGSPSAPSPWKGSPSVIFKGCNYFKPDRCPKTKSGKDRYDSGAIRILNISQEDLTITKAKVIIGSCTFHPWPKLNVTIKPEEQVILTQTGGKPPCGSARSNFNFDSSDTSSSCTANSVTPALQVTVSGETLTYSDPSQTLNTGGKDRGKKACGHHNETHDWVQMVLPL